MRQFEERWAGSILASFAPAEAQPSPERLAPRPGEIDPLQTLKTMLDGSTRLGRLGIRLAVWLLAFSPLWSLGRPRLFPSLEPEARTHLLHRLLDHRSFAVRELCLLLKVVACMALLSPESVQARTRYLPQRGAPDAQAALPDPKEIA